MSSANTPTNHIDKREHRQKQHELYAQLRRERMKWSERRMLGKTLCQLCKTKIKNWARQKYFSGKSNNFKWIYFAF